MKLMKFTKIKAGIATAIVGGIVFAACGNPTGAKANSQQQGQQITESYSNKLTKTQPYPLSQMNNSDERANLRERLLRLNDPNKIGYVYMLGQNGQVISYYTVKGKISSTASQLTPTAQANEYCQGDPGTSDNGSNGYECSWQDHESMGDDGSYGQEEGGQNGIFFFTTTGVLVEWDGLWVYSDAPLNITTPPLITINANATPSSQAGQLGK